LTEPSLLITPSQDNENEIIPNIYDLNNDVEINEESTDSDTPPQMARQKFTPRTKDSGFSEFSLTPDDITHISRHQLTPIPEGRTRRSQIPLSPIISPGLPQTAPRTQPYFSYDLRPNTSSETTKKTPLTSIFKRKSGKGKKTKIDDSPYELSIQGTLIPSTPIIHVPHNNTWTPQETSEVIGYSPLTSSSYFSLPQRSNRSSPVDMSNTLQQGSSRDIIPWLPPDTHTGNESHPISDIPNEKEEIETQPRTQTKYSLRKKNTPSYIEESYRKQYKPRTKIK